ncbi:hypothetical protein Bealeia1_00866 [Candidatus Bealeia paramacronuclearis]|uniref:WAP domain-containing protein n=1 Tax=Candidatus Bealeia paramacronuclearis TaxID=1921001 RepID=A0ABZ2C2V5_9PROT|nr:hypothetical protein [Candidatus Bealeia paramacronuclearis]
MKTSRYLFSFAFLTILIPGINLRADCQSNADCPGQQCCFSQFGNSCALMCGGELKKNEAPKNH